METTYIMSAVRTPIGRYGGSLKSVPAHTLAAAVVREAVQRSGVDQGWIEEVILGETRQSTEASNMARHAALEAGLPETTPAFTVNRLCGSGLQSAAIADLEIRCGQAQAAVAGGADNMSRVPMYIRNGRWGGSCGPMQMVDPNIEAGTTAQPADVYGTDLSMARTAENVAARFGISREQQDRFAFESQQKAAKAWKLGWYEKEIVPISVKERKNEFIFDKDEFLKPDTTPERLAQLRSITGPEGTVTAGNACGLNDGAAALLLMGEETVQRSGLAPRARIVGISRTALDPRIMGIGPVPAIRKVLAQTGMTPEQMDLIELNEAFAAQAVACIQELRLDPAKVNIGGGAIALGHPLGCTGARLLVTLLHHLERTGGRYGLASLCIGGGQGMAAVIERIG